MNERIRELELQAIAYADSKVPAEDRYNDIYHSIVRRMLVELIIRECMQVARSENEGGKRADVWDRGWILGVESVREAIAEHFGVEE